MATEFYSLHPATKSAPEYGLRRGFSETRQDLASAREKFSLGEQEFDEIMKLVADIREQFIGEIEALGKGNISEIKQGVRITGPAEILRVLRKTQQEDAAFFSQLVELIGVSYVELDANTGTEKLNVELLRSPGYRCPRCRKQNRQPEMTICSRCSEAEASRIIE